MGWNGRQGAKNHGILREASNSFGEKTTSLTSVVAEAMEKEKFTQDFQGTRWIDSLTVPYEGTMGERIKR